MKNIHKYMIISAVLILILLACSCGSAGSVDIVRDGKVAATVVYSSDMASADDLAYALYTSAEKKIAVIADDEEPEEGQSLILVGRSSYPETDRLKYLKSGEYLIEVVGGRLVIGGADKETTAKAVDYFVEKYIKESGGDISYSGSEKGGEVPEEYTRIDTVKLLGRPIADYKIVYPYIEGTYTEKETTDKYCAETIARYIKKRSGYCVDVVGDNTDEGKYEILVGRTNRKESGKPGSVYSLDISISGEKLAILAGGLMAVNRACELLFTGKDVNITAKNAEFSSDDIRSEIEGAKDKGYVYVSDDMSPAVPSVTLSGNDISDYSVYWFNEDDIDDGERYAAEEFCNYVNKAVGTALEAEKAPESITGKAVLIGQVPGEHISADTSGIGDEGFLVENKGDRLVIYSKTGRGAVYGVYDLLETEFGYRFYAKDCETLAVSDGVEIGDGYTYTESPIYEYRDIFSKNAFDASYSVKRKINGFYQRSIPVEMGSSFDFAGGNGCFVHTMSSVYGISKSYTQPCLTDEDNFERTLKMVRGYLSIYKDSPIISITQNDNNNVCECGNCRKVNNEEGSKAGTLVRFINRIAEAIKDDYPDVKILTLAYMYSCEPTKTAPADNVVIELCSFEWCDAHGLNDLSCTKNDDSRRQLNGWHELTDNLYMWLYAADLAIGKEDVPYMNLDAMYDTFSYFRDHGVKGIFTESHGDFQDCEFDDLRSYLTSILMWDPYISKLEYDRCIADFIDAYYGDASEYVKRYYDFLSSISGTHHFSLYSSVDAVVDRNIFKLFEDELEEWWSDALEANPEDSSFSTRCHDLQRSYEYVKNKSN
ncbi:MAG: DUF4838 domain-containing protein [Clostridia bacterium]|nr:DUF4838 domain-containing protein [Clostridia bacterium]